MYWRTVYHSFPLLLSCVQEPDRWCYKMIISKLSWLYLLLQIAEIVNSGIQPYQNTGLIRQLTAVSVIDGSQSGPNDVPALVRSYIAKGLSAIEALIEECWSQSLSASGKRYAVGTSHPTIADIYLIPQIYSAKRFGLSLEPYPRCMEVFALAESLPSFISAAPANQPDAV